MVEDHTYLQTVTYLSTATATATATATTTEVQEVAETALSSCLNSVRADSAGIESLLIIIPRSANHRGL